MPRLSFQCLAGVYPFSYRLRLLAIGAVRIILAALVVCGCSTQPHLSSRSKRLSSPKTTVVRSGSPVLADDTVIARAPITDSAEENLARAHAHYAAGVIHEMNDENDAALDEYYLAALNDPGNDSLLLDISRRFLQRKQPEKALELLTHAAARPNASGAIYARLGFVYAQLGKNEQALSANRTAIKRSPQLLAGYQNLFVMLMQSKHQEEALKVLDEAAKQKNPGPEFLVGLAEVYGSFVLQVPSQRSKVQDRALALLDRAEKLKISDSLLRWRLAEGYNLLGAGAKAAPLYLELLKRLPDVPTIREQLHARLAGIYLRGSDRTNAIEQLQAIVRDDPTNPQAYYYLGYLSYVEKKGTEAVEYLNKAIMLSPDFAEAYYQLALAHLSLNEGSNALQTLDVVRKKFPDNFLLEFYSGLAHGEQKDYQAALRDFTAAEVMAKATEPKLLDREFYFQLGASYERTGDYPHAEQYFKKCLELSPDWAEACNYLGYMWADRGQNLEQARELIEKAVKAEPKNAAFLDSLGWVLFKQNQAGEALKYVQQALELSEKPDPTLLDHLGDIFASLKQLELAREAWEKSLALEKNEAIEKKLEAARGK